MKKLIWQRDANQVTETWFARTSHTTYVVWEINGNSYWSAGVIDNYNITTLYDRNKKDAQDVAQAHYNEYLKNQPSAFSKVMEKVKKIKNNLIW